MNKLLVNIGLGLAIALLLCLLPMPYGYYTLIRFVAMVVFACMAFSFYSQNKLPLCVLAAALALLFQPFIKIALGRGMWNVVDVVVAIGLVALWWKNKAKVR